MKNINKNDGSRGIFNKIVPRILKSMLIGTLFTSAALQAQPISGTKTVCTSSCDYTTLTAAIADIKAKGVSGPVTVSIAAGNYNLTTGVTIEGIPGVSATNTLTLKGAGKKTTRLYGTGASASGGVVEIRN